MLFGSGIGLFGLLEIMVNHGFRSGAGSRILVECVVGLLRPGSYQLRMAISELIKFLPFIFVGSANESSVEECPGESRHDVEEEQARSVKESRSRSVKECQKGVCQGVVKARAHSAG
jgi:hypothetical protein